MRKGIHKPAAVLVLLHDYIREIAHIEALLLLLLMFLCSPFPLTALASVIAGSREVATRDCMLPCCRAWRARFRRVPECCARRFRTGPRRGLRVVCVVVAKVLRPLRAGHRAPGHKAGLRAEL